MTSLAKLRSVIPRAQCCYSWFLSKINQNTEWKYLYTCNKKTVILCMIYIGLEAHFCIIIIIILLYYFTEWYDKEPIIFEKHFCCTKGSLDYKINK